MKITFLCGCLEPGCDGVGDYTLQLAAELIRQGSIANAVSLYDKFIQEPFTGEQKVGLVSINVCRIPSHWKNKERYKYLEKYIMDSDPGWISLQYVPFSFNKKGLPFTLAHRLRTLGRGRKWHIMFHELWVGMKVNSSKKFVWWGWLQRQIIRRLIINLNPKAIHTQSRLYQYQLNNLGFKTEYLPLFSNIPKIESIIDTNGSIDQHSISMVMFGSIHPGGPVEDFAKEVSLYARKKKIEVNLVILGRSGPEKERWIKSWKVENLPVKLYGEQSPQLISEILQKASFGITTNPGVLTEKSGTVASMREHGLRIICVSKEWQAKGCNSIQPLTGIIEYKRGNFEPSIAESQKYTWSYKTSDAIEKILEDFRVNS